MALIVRRYRSKKKTAQEIAQLKDVCEPEGNLVDFTANCHIYNWKHLI
jgi:hypothetical protein